jgi:hypothetical protein
MKESIVTVLLVISGACICACSTVEATGEAVDSAGRGLGTAVSGVGHGAGEIVSGAGEAVENGAKRTQRKGY